MIFRSAIALVLLAAAPYAATAQHAPDRFGDHEYVVSTYSQLSTPSVARSLVSPRTALVLAGVGALFPLDESISRSMRDSTLQTNDILQHSKDVMNTFGSPGVLVLAVGAWAGGALAESDGLRDSGWHATQAIAVSSIATTIIKELAGRVRPNSSPDDPFDFTFAGGLKDRGGLSFPSGHATAAFAFSVTIAEELEARHPDIAKYTTPAAYGVATLAALARVYDQKHWPSDVLLGAAIGTVTARIITKHAHRKPDQQD